MAEGLQCPVCHDVFKDPVILTCSHSCCKICIKKYWEVKGTQECPVCRAISQGDPVRNLALKNVCSAPLVLDESDVTRCCLHRERHSLFCENDEQLACLVCQQAKQHISHCFSPLEEAAAERKGKVEKVVQSMKNKLRALVKEKTTTHSINETMKTQAHDTERQIKLEFEKLHQFLRDEEASRIAALKKEEKKKSQMINEEIRKISTAISSLSENIREIEENIRADNTSFLKDYKDTMERAERSYSQAKLQHPERLPGTLINVADYLGNLKFIICEKMQTFSNLTPVTLDPNTANPHLIVSEDLTHVEYQQQLQPLPDNSERFDHYPCVLGSEGFDSGVHCWEVEVGESTYWELGVMAESGERKGEYKDENESNCWIVRRSNNAYVARSGMVNFLRWFFDRSYIPITVKEEPTIIRVYLDFDIGRLSFINPDNDEYLHTFSYSFSEKLFPYFKTKTKMAILPRQSVIAVEQLITNKKELPPKPLLPLHKKK